MLDHVVYHVNHTFLNDSTDIIGYGLFDLALDWQVGVSRNPRQGNLIPYVHSYIISMCPSCIELWAEIQDKEVEIVLDNTCLLTEGGRHIMFG